MFGIRAAIPATSRLNVIKYANLASLLQTNELLGNYRNLFWFGSPIGLPLVEWTAAVVYGGVLTFAFCWVFARAQLLSASKRGFLLGLRHKTHATSVYKEEARKLLLLNGAALVLAAFAGFGIYQGVTAESYIGPDEIYYAYYMKHTSGPFTQESYDWLEEQGEEFAPMLEVQRKVAAGELSSDAMLAFSSLQQKYSVYSRVINQNINYYLKEHPGAWLVYESGYKELFGFTGDADVQDTLLAGLACALCFSGLFSMERRGGMETILCTTPLGRNGFTAHADGVGVLGTPGADQTQIFADGQHLVQWDGDLAGKIDRSAICGRGDSGFQLCPACDGILGGGTGCVVERDFLNGEIIGKGAYFSGNFRVGIAVGFFIFRQFA